MARHIIESTTFFSLTPYAMRESILSIASSDYSVGFVTLDILKGALERKETVVLNSSFFNLAQFEEILDLALAQKEFLRVQVSVGAELEKYHEILISFLECGGSVDILVDRPVRAENILLQRFFDLSKDLRFCVVANKYFSLNETLNSLPEAVKSKTVVLFLPPTIENSCYFAADEVVRQIQTVQNDEDSIRILVFKNWVIGQDSLKNRNFFLTLEFEKYYGSSDWHQDLQGLRKSLSWMLKRKMIFLIDFIYSALVFLRNPSLKNFSGMFQLLKARALGLGHWTFIIVRHRFLNPIYVFFRYHAYPKTRDFIRYQVYSKSRDFVRYQLFHFLKISMGLVCYPLRKIYWMLEYQIRTRLVPLIKSEGKE